MSARTSAARAKLHRALDEYLDAVEAAVGAPTTDSDVTPTKESRPISDIDKARARKALRRLGVDL